MKRIFLYMLRTYQKHISPMKRHSTCKFSPTCSQYAIDAILKYGAFKGAGMAVWRVLRCNPFSDGGYDPVK